MWCCVVNRHQCFREDCCLHLNEEEQIFPRHWHLSASTHTAHVQGLILMFAAMIPGDGYLWIRVIPWIESWFVCFWPNSPQWARASSFMSFLDHTRWHTIVGRTPLDEWSALSQRPLPDNTQHSQQTDIHAPGGIRTHSLSRRAAADPRPRLRGHCDWWKLVCCHKLDTTVLLKIITDLHMNYNCNMEGNWVVFYIAEWMSIWNFETHNIYTVPLRTLLLSCIVSLPFTMIWYL
jgi:hypothetical protein